MIRTIALSIALGLPLGASIAAPDAGATVPVEAAIPARGPVPEVLVPSGLVPCPIWLCSDGKTDCGIFIYKPTYYISSGTWRPINPGDFNITVCRGVLNGKGASNQLYKVPICDYSYYNATVTLSRSKTGGYVYFASNDHGAADLKDPVRWCRSHLIPLAKF